MKLFSYVSIFVIFFSCKKAKEYYPKNFYENGEELSVGLLTNKLSGSNAFNHAVPNLPLNEDLLFYVGNSLFQQSWIRSGGSTTARDGLGPTFNANACSECHRKVGRGKPLEAGQRFSKGFLLRISKPGKNIYGGPKPVHGYGNQIQERSNLGISIEANVEVNYEFISGSFDDGEPYELRKPIYSIVDEQFGSLQGVFTSPRVGQQVIGLGLIDALAVEDILINQDEFDSNNDGISGKANLVWNFSTNKTQVGRFGWKANEPTLLQQVASAFSGDIGLTNSVFPNKNCPSPQKDCNSEKNGGNPEVSDRQLNNIMVYSSSLSVPIRRNYDKKNVLNGKKLFRDMKCNSCHKEVFKTSDNYPFNPTLQNITIRPFSDFLLHDMGEGLADNRSDYLANGKEWRTQPLWGLGLIQEVNKHNFLLHDGRARGIQEAILWHSGEAEKSKNSYKRLTKKDRENVLAFLNSL
jgi:CxxC motif-containing protein (DUF1111 family)